MIIATFCYDASKAVFLCELTIADYRDLGSVELAIKDGALSKLECLRLNENIITR